MKAMRGFTLIELLISLSIGLIIIGLLSMLVFNLTNINKRNLAYSKTQENLRSSIFFIKKAVETAGYIGCPNILDNVEIKNLGVDSSQIISKETSFILHQGIDASWNPPIPKLKITPLQNTDVIEIREMSPQSAYIKNSIEKGTSEITVGDTPNFENDDDIVLSDCTHAVFLHILHVTHSITSKKQRLLLSIPIDSDFDANAMVGHIQVSYFIIANTNRKNHLGEFISALYLVDGLHHKTELVDGIVNIKAECLLLQSTDGEFKCEDPAFVSDFKNVIAVRLSILAKSTEKIPHYYSEYVYKSIDNLIFLKER